MEDRPVVVAGMRQRSHVVAAPRGVLQYDKDSIDWQKKKTGKPRRIGTVMAAR